MRSAALPADDQSVSPLSSPTGPSIPAGIDADGFADMPDFDTAVDPGLGDQLDADDERKGDLGLSAALSGAELLSLWADLDTSGGTATGPAGQGPRALAALDTDAPRFGISQIQGSTSSPDQHSLPVAPAPTTRGLDEFLRMQTPPAPPPSAQPFEAPGATLDHMMAQQYSVRMFARRARASADSVSMHMLKASHADRNNLMNHYAGLLAAQQRQARVSSEAVSGSHSGEPSFGSPEHSQEATGDTHAAPADGSTEEHAQLPLWALQNMQLGAGAQPEPVAPQPVHTASMSPDFQRQQRAALEALFGAGPGAHSQGFNHVPLPSANLQTATMSPLRVLAHARAAAAQSGYDMPGGAPAQHGNRQARASWPLPPTAYSSMGGMPYAGSPLAHVPPSDAERAALAHAMHGLGSRSPTKSPSHSNANAAKPLRCRGKIDKGCCERCGARMRGFGAGYCTNKECREIAARTKRSSGSRGNSPMPVFPAHATATS
mmetsp:Transcript_11870/g.35176  ORF Transcript_11870/g.35176 Transcript_11870/m.35176 type:complete len:490 (+) Transcript_11870:88-1557(+)